MADENINVRVRLRDSLKFNKDTRKAADEVDNLGDQASRAARKFRQLNRDTANTRVNLGPLSTSVRRVPLMFGVAALATQKWTGAILSLGEAAATVGAGGMAGGAVGLTALAQGALVAKLGLDGMGEALGGNEDALKRLTPEARSLFAVLDDANKQLKSTANAGIMPGLIGGGNAAMRNLPVVNKIVGDTAGALGGLAQSAGDMVGSKAWGRDLAKIGGRNVNIIENLGEGALSLADAGRHILVAAGPLAEWLSEIAENGAASAESFLKTKRETGELSQFFRDARRDLQLLGSATGHGGRGIINLFGAQDVDGTRTLRNFDQLMARFERWSSSPAAQRGIGQALIDEIPEHADDLAVAIAETIGRAAPMAAGLFWDSFWQSSAEGKAVLGAAVLWKSGAFKALGGALSQRLGMGGRVPVVGKGKMAAVPVIVTNPGWGGERDRRRKQPPGAPPSRKPTSKPPTKTAPARPPTPAPTRPAPSPRGGVAATVATLILGEAMPEGKVRDLLFGDGRFEAAAEEELMRQALRARGPAKPSTQTPFHAPSAFISPFAKPATGLPEIRLTLRTDIDGREVARSQRRINLEDKRRFGGRPVG